MPYWRNMEYLHFCTPSSAPYTVDVAMERHTPILCTRLRKQNYVEECTASAADMASPALYDFRGRISEHPLDRSFAWSLDRKFMWTRRAHRWVLPVLRYPRNMVIYHNPHIGVIFMVILLIFIIQNYPNFFSKYHPEFTIRVIYPFIFNLGEF